MPVDVHGKSAPAAIGAPRANNIVGMIAKGKRLGAGEKATNATRDNIVEREQVWLRNGGQLVFPLPKLDIVRAATQ